MKSENSLLFQLLSTLPANVYINLHEHLGISKTYLTQFLKEPSIKGNISIIQDLSKLTGVKNKDLVKEYRIGTKSISYSQFEELEQLDKLKK